jgi:hypothetical protein
MPSASTLAQPDPSDRSSVPVTFFDVMYACVERICGQSTDRRAPI